MNTPDNKMNRKTSFYKRPRFYIWGVFYLIVGTLLLLILSVTALRWINPSFTSFTLQENWSDPEADRYSLREWWVPADEIPEHLKWAVIASEDQLFREHQGFDFESIQEAWEERQSGERSRGASTITQQVVKNIYLWPAESYIRKGIEAGITVLIELIWPKERIMEVYLNIAEFGPGLYGIGRASNQIFGIDVPSLEPGMSARLAAVLPNPKQMRVEPASPFTQERSRWILRQMTHLSGIIYHQIEQEENLADENNSEQPSVDDIDPEMTDTLKNITRVPIDTTTLDTLNLQPKEFLADSLPSEIVRDSLSYQQN